MSAKRGRGWGAWLLIALAAAPRAAFAQTTRDPPEATQLEAEGERLHDEGKYDAAVPVFEHLLALRERVLGPTSAEVALALDELAMIHVELGDYARAEPLYQRALAIASAIPTEADEVASVLSNLSDLYLKEGDYARAERDELRALEMREKLFGADHPDVALSLSGLGRIYAFRGDYARAEPLLVRVVTIHEKAGDKGRAGVTSGLAALGTLYMDEGDYARAVPLLERVLAMREAALGKDHPYVANVLSNLGISYLQQGDHARAEPLLDRALAIRERALGKDHPTVAETLGPLVDLYAVRGDPGRAQPLAERALAIREKALGGDHLDVARSLERLAHVHLARGDVEAALAAEARSADIVARSMSLALATGSEAQKLAYDDRYRGHVDRVISMHASSAPADPAARRLALTAVLRHKGLVLDAMIDGLAALRRHLTAADQALLDRLASVASRLGAAINRGPGKRSPEDHRRTLEALEAERQALEAELGARSSAFRAEFHAVTLADVAGAIPEDAALLELVRYTPYDVHAPTLRARKAAPPRYAAYVLRRTGEPSFADLGEASPIDQAAGALRAALAGDALGRDPRPAARDAYARIMAPVRALLGDTRRVLVSPDADLALVPFAALMDETGHYLIERFSFTYLTSGRDLLRRGDRPSPRQGPLVVAAPSYGPSSSGPPLADGKRGRRARSLQDHLPVAPLPGSQKEAQAIAARLPGARVLLGAEATEGAVKGAHAPVILHLATHGFFFEQPRGVENPLLRSGLLLAGANALDGGGGDDGVLTALEVSELDLYGTRLVVLSACDTGLGKASAGEGVYGLRRALSMAGAETTAMSLWDADDDATRALMTGYYDRLMKGEGRGEAMREAQLALLARPETAHPSLWAAFIVSGDDGPMDARGAEVPRVAKGARGCACAAPAGEDRGGVGAAAALLLLAGMGARRRGRAPATRARSTR